jgi:hypothetical protein
MKVRWAKRVLSAALTALVGTLGTAAQAQYQSFYPVGDSSGGASYRTAFPTEGSLAAGQRNLGYLPVDGGPPRGGRFGRAPGAMPGGPLRTTPYAQPPGPVLPAGYEAGMAGPMPCPLPSGAAPMRLPGVAPPPGYPPAYSPQPVEYESGDGGGLRGLLGPFFAGASGPRWFDASVEYLYMWRENHASFQPFTSNGIAGNAPPNIVLDSEDLDYSGISGVRVFLRHEVGAKTTLEGGYFGIYGSHASAAATSANDNLFSVFSDFGNNPFQGFGATDRSDLQRIRSESMLNSVELNLRRQWMGGYGWLQGSWLMGVRYLSFNDSLSLFTHSTYNNASLDYDVQTYNDMIGFQLGGDAYVSVLPGLLVGGEVKTGIYGNQAVQNTNIASGSLNTREHADTGAASFVGDARVMAIWQVRPSFSITGGYQVLVLDGVALGVENFNATPPMGNPSARENSVFIDNNGTAFYHGFFAGAEWMW